MVSPTVGPMDCWADRQWPDDIPTIESRLSSRGLALFWGIHNRKTLLDLARSFGEVQPHPHSEPDGVTVIAPDDRNGSAIAGFTRRALEPHTDRADLAVPPFLLLMVCVVAPAEGGECTFVDGRAVFKDLACRAPDALQVLQQADAVSYGERHVFTGPVFESVTGRLRIRVWPPEMSRFSPTTVDAWAELRRSISRHTHVMALEAGQGYIIDNHRWLHGRQAFTGTRCMQRLALTPGRSSQIQTGFRQPNEN